MNTLSLQAIRNQSNLKNRYLFLTMLAGLSCMSLAYAGGDGSVHGSNTIDKIEIDGFTPSVYGYEVAACGKGSNTLTVKVQQKKSGLGWKTIDDMTVNPGNTKSGQYTVSDLVSGDEKIRYKFSRKIGTKEIEYAYEHYYLPFSHTTPQC